MSASDGFFFTFFEAEDRAVLIALYESTNGPNWSRISWDLSAADGCTWGGVDCLNGRVRRL